MSDNRIIIGHPADLYYVRQLEVASNSGLAIIDERSPMHYRYWADNPDADRDSEALAFGKAFHCAVLEPDQFGDLYAVLPEDAPLRPTAIMQAAYLKGTSNDSSKHRVEWWQDWGASNAGRTMMTASAYQQAQAMGESLRMMRMAFGSTTVTAGELFDSCEKEVTAYWIDEETGIQCKLRADIYEPDLGFAGDVKSCLDSGFEAFARAAFRHRYHVQHAHYCEGFRACGQPLKTFGFFPVEKQAPHVPASWHLNAAAESRGWEIRQRSMAKLKRCLDSGEWPGHTTTMQEIALPAFAFYSLDE